MTLFNIRHNKIPVRCSTCRVMIAPGDGLAWRCRGSAGDCAEHPTKAGGWHCHCADERACWRRARQRHEASMRRRSSILERLEGQREAVQEELFR